MSRQIITRAEARALGKRFYFSGQKCKAGHISMRYVSTGACQECTALKTKIYYYAHREKYLAQFRQRYWADPEAARIRAKKYYISYGGN